MKRLLQILLCAALAAGSAWLAAEAADGAAGTNASTAGGAALGGTGIGSPDPRKEREADSRIRIQKKPEQKPETAPEQPASAGPSRDRARNLSEEADRQDAEFRKKNAK
jgi:hypothetical protein